METKEFEEYINQLFDKYIRVVMYGVIVIMYGVIALNGLHSSIEKLLIFFVLSVVIGETLLRIFKWLFIKVPLYFKKKKNK